MKWTGQDSIRSWTAAICCCLINMVISGTARVSGLLFVATMDTYQVDRQTAAFPYTSAYFTQTLAGTVAGFVAYRVGVSTIITTGCLFAALGMGMCFWAESVTELIIFWGLFFGSGLGVVLMFPIVIAQQFTMHRALAMNITYFGTYLGSLLLPFIVDFFLRTYSISGTFLLLSGITLNSIPLSLLLRRSLNLTKNVSEVCNEKASQPCQKTSKIPTRDNKIEEPEVLSERKRINGSFSIKNGTDVPDFQHATNLSVYKSRKHEASYGCCQEKSVILPDGENIDHSNNYQLGFDHEEDSLYHSKVNAIEEDSNKIKNCHQTNTKQIREENLHFGSKEPSTERKTAQLKKIMEIFMEPVFVIVLFGAGFVAASLIGLITAIVDFCNDIGLQADSETYILSLHSLSSIFGSLFLGKVIDRTSISVTTWTSFLLFARSVTCSVLPSVKTFEVLAAMISLIGFFESSLLSLCALIISEYFCDEIQKFAIPSMLLLCAPMDLMTPIFIGIFRDKGGSYNGFFFLISGSSLLFSALFLMIPVVSKMKCRKDGGLMRKNYADERDTPDKA